MCIYIHFIHPFPALFVKHPWHYHPSFSALYSPFHFSASNFPGMGCHVLCPLSPFIGILPLTFLAAGCALPFLIPAFTHFKHQLPDASRISQYSFSLFYFFSSASFSCCWALQLTAFLLLLLSAAPGCTEL